MLIDKKLHLEIKEYCKLNNLKMGEFINELLRKAFNIEKYGISPFSPIEKNIIEPTLMRQKENILTSSIEVEEKKDENEKKINKKRKLI